MSTGRGFLGSSEDGEKNKNLIFEIVMTHFVIPTDQREWRNLRGYK